MAKTINFPIKVGLVVFIITILFRSGSSNFDLYIPENEVYKLFGIQAELYYIHDGKVNHNAVAFLARVQPDHSVLKYMWKVASLEVQVPYDIELTWSNDSSIEDESQNIIHHPFTNLKPNGLVTSGAFEVYVNCTGQKTGNVTFEMKLILLIPYQEFSEKVAISIKRLKKCEKIESIPAKETVATDPFREDSPTETTRRPTSTGGTQQSMSAFYIAIAVVTTIIVVIIFVCCGWHYRINKRHKELGSDALHRVHMSNHHGNQFLRLDLPNNAQHPPSHSGMVQFSSFINDLGTDINEIRGKLTDIAIPRNNIILGELLIKGTFARIYKGALQDGTNVLVKTVTEAATEEQKRLLLFESSLFRGMQHRNLLTLKNVVLDNNNSPVPMVLFNFREGGNLKHFLQSLKVNDTPGAIPGIFSSNLTKCDQVSTQELVEMAIQVAFGMTYLSKRGLVHKDVAARNCVIDNDMKIKITDYALSRDAFPRDYCCLGDSENRPVRWLALESLVHKVYSSASDVWSFGVLLWELQSLAATPYSDIDDFEMEDYLSDGFRLSQPINCPDLLYSIMAGCWHYSPDQRPSFPQLLNLLTDFFAELGDYV